MNPFMNVTRIPTSQQILDIAFSRAMKVSSPPKKIRAWKRTYLHEQARISTAVNIIRSRLLGVVHEFPSLDNIHPFYHDLLDIMIGVDAVKQTLGAVQGAVATIESIQKEINKTMLETSTPQQITRLRQVAFGRISSQMNRVKPHLKFLAKVRMKMRRIPGFDPSKPCVVLCGPPNTGKSSFIRASTTGTPEIGSYPFTTKQLYFGHKTIGFLQVQFVDTPGLLDRPLHERNDIELKSLIALRHISDIDLFIFDPTPGATLTPQQQIHLYNELKEFYTESIFFPVIGKADTLTEQEKQHALETFPATHFLSTTSEDGIKEVWNDLESLILEKVIKSPKFKEQFKPVIIE